MTAPSHTDGDEVRSAATVLRDTARAEWARLWTLRATWWSVAAAGALMLLISAAAGAGHTGEEPAPIWQAAQIGMVPAQFAFLAVVLVAVAGEHATGMIRSTLQWTPRRGVLFATRVLVPVLFAAGSALLFAAASNLVAWGLVGDAAEVVPFDIAASLGRIVLVVGFGGVMTAGLSLWLRSTAGTITAIFLLMLALPVALGNAGVPWLTTVSDALPGRAVISMLVVDETELPPRSIAIVAIAWSTAATVVGAHSLLRRDAT